MSVSTDLAPSPGTPFDSPRHEDDDRSGAEIVDGATYTPKQMAELLGVHPNRARTLLSTGVIPAARMGRVYRIRGAAIRAYREQRATLPDYLTVPQAAKELRVNVDTVRGLIHAGTLPAWMVGGKFRIAPADVDALFEAAAS